jgi:polyisoprenoid-binding protein YceI
MNKSIGIVLFAGVLPFSAQGAPESYTVDARNSFSYFSVLNAGVTPMMGRFDRATARFTIDREAKAGSLDVTMQAASVSTGDNDRGNRARTLDEHLRSPDFFNAAEFPTLVYKSTKVQFKGDAPETIEGSFTMLGVTRPLTLQVDSWKCGVHPVSKRQLCGGTAAGQLKRSEFGMKYGIPLVSDEVKLLINVIAYKDTN